jgi:hypothetical protein
MTALLAAGPAMAAEGTCTANALDKKLAAAKASFTKKCVKGAVGG